MYYDLKHHYWWCGMNKDIVVFVLKYLNCQKVKYDHQQLGCTMQIMPIQKWKWEHITMDFVVGLLPTWGSLIPLA